MNCIIMVKVNTLGLVVVVGKVVRSAFGTDVSI